MNESARKHTDFSWEYPGELMAGLNNLRNQDQLCDIIFCVGGKSFPAHKAVLAAAGEYFRAMFTSGFRESSENKITIDGSAEAFQILLEFAYTGEIEFLQISTCIFEAVEMACYTQFTRFAKACSSAIVSLIERVIAAMRDCEVDGLYKISVSDTCKVMLLAEKHNYLKKLHEVSLEYLEQKVEDLKSLDVFLEHTSMTLLQAFLSRKNLSNEDEEKQVLGLVINWLKHDWEKRKKHSHQLLQKVRLALVDSEDIKELIGPEILDIPECLELVNHVLQVQASKKPRDVLSIENPEIAATRSTITTPILSRRGIFLFYAADHDDWIPLDRFAPLPSETARYSMVVADGILYALGGNEGTEFYRYQTGANKWLQLPPMSERQNFTKLVSLGGCIYAVGIHRRKSFHHAFEGPGIMIERYDIKEEKWEVVELPPSNWHDQPGRVPNNKRSAKDHKQAISALVFEGKILVSSVRRMRSRNSFEYTCHYLEESLMYDPESDNWQITEIGLTEEDALEEARFTMKPFLFIYKDQLHRILDYYYNHLSEHAVSVNHVILQSEDDGTIKVMIGDEVSQEDELTEPVFCIGDIEFVIRKGAVCLVEYNKVQNLALEPGNLNVFPDFSIVNSSSTPVLFTFDKKKLRSEYYIYE